MTRYFVWVSASHPSGNLSTGWYVQSGGKIAGPYLTYDEALESVGIYLSPERHRK